MKCSHADYCYFALILPFKFVARKIWECVWKVYSQFIVIFICTDIYRGYAHGMCEYLCDVAILFVNLTDIVSFVYTVKST